VFSNDLDPIIPPSIQNNLLTIFSGTRDLNFEPMVPYLYIPDADFSLYINSIG
jgi:hypothetical protein